MRAAIFTALYLIAGTPLLTPEEPPFRLVLQIDGQEHQLVAGREATIEIGGQQRKVVATVAATRQLDAAGVQFEFPRDMGFESKVDGNMHCWTLLSTKVIVQVFTVKDLGIGIARSTLENLIGSNELAEATLVLGGKSHPALAGEVRSKGNERRLLGADIEVGKGRVTILLQDMVDDDSKPNQDYARMLELLTKTFVVRESK